MTENTESKEYYVLSILFVNCALAQWAPLPAVGRSHY